MKAGEKRKCIICGKGFQLIFPGPTRKVCCSPGCSEVRKRRYKAAWYAANRQHVIARATESKARKKAEAGAKAGARKKARPGGKK